MIQNTLVRILLAPFSLLYGIGVGLRNFFYSNNLLRGVEFDIPVISVGNLSIGGAGKTPHIEYLIRLLKDYIFVATLSRGYKRKTKGYLVVQPNFTAESVGDEPLQFKRKFPDVFVSISESRAYAIPSIMMDYPRAQTILLDDAFQHRSVKPGLNILLTEFDRPFTRDFLMPSGRLREWRSAYHRADIIIVSKCPPQITEQEKIDFIDEIRPFPAQRIFFSYYRYQNPYFIFQRNYILSLKENVDVLLICAIANTDYLLKYLYEKVAYVKALEYEDHHFFNEFDLSNLKNEFDKIESERKIILTTEKDAMRLELHRNFIIQNKLPIYVLPVEVAFHFNEGQVFDNAVEDFLLNFRA
jgi:tetraacyldisaccharide 4'-kinase